MRREPLHEQLAHTNGVPAVTPDLRLARLAVDRQRRALSPSVANATSSGESWPPLILSTASRSGDDARVPNFWATSSHALVGCLTVPMRLRRAGALSMDPSPAACPSIHTSGKGSPASAISRRPLIVVCASRISSAIFFSSLERLKPTMPVLTAEIPRASSRRYLGTTQHGRGARIGQRRKNGRRESKRSCSGCHTRREEAPPAGERRKGRRPGGQQRCERDSGEGEKHCSRGCAEFEVLVYEYSTRALFSLVPNRFPIVSTHRRSAPKSAPQREQFPQHSLVACTPRSAPSACVLGRLLTAAWALSRQMCSC